MSRWAVPAVALGLLVALVAPSAPSAYTNPGLTYLCSPPPLTQQNCLGWHNVPVDIVWAWDISVAKAVKGECGDQTLSENSDGKNVLASCTVEDRMDGIPTMVGAKLKIDRTRPVITGASPARPPDAGGWWNRPVSFTFAGTDSLSGMASCDTVTYAGPGGPGALVTGGCRDVAGNYGVASFPLNFDSAPPTLSHVKATPQSQSAAISWDASPDAARARVTRTSGSHASAATMVYSGRGDHFTDSGIINGKTYRYRVTVYDAADNASSRTVHAKPAISLGLKPGRNARLKRPPLLRWPAVRHAAYYNVQLFRGDVKVLTVWPARAHLRLRGHQRYHGVHIRLGKGHYRWYVWPGYGSRAAHRYGAFLGHSSFVLVR